MDAKVRVELEHLLNYARAVGAAAKREPDRADVVDGGRGYLGGALTTMHHLGLVTEAERAQWWDRLMGELPPTQWIDG